MRYLLADPALTSRTPGEEFARHVTAAGGADVDVRLAVSLPTLFPLAAHRPRYTVRHLLKTAVVTGDPTGYIQEPRPVGVRDTSGVSYRDTPEALFTARWASARLTDVTATVGVPAGLSADPALLAAFVDHRLIVRLCTVENEVLLQGSTDKAITGLLNLPDLRRRAAPGELGLELTRAAGEVEEMGGSCDGIVVHPHRYWELVNSGLLERLSHAGVRVSRTRMLGVDQALLGDYRAAVTLLETGESTIGLQHGDGVDTLTASIRMGLAEHLPQHFLLLELA
jgi:hypothetical protein